MARDLLERWKQIPYRLSRAGSLGVAAAGAYWIGDFYLGDDSRSQLALLFFALSAIAFLHELIYRRKSPRRALLSLMIVAVILGSGTLISLNSFEDSYLGLLPIFAGMIAAGGLDSLVGKLAGKVNSDSKPPKITPSIAYP